MGLPYLDKRIQYIIYLDATYIIAFLISMMSFIPEVEVFQRGVLIMLFASCIYFVVRVSQSVWGLDFCLSSPWCYYISRIFFTVTLFVFHLMLMHTSILISGNLMISQKIVKTIRMPEEHVTFYIYNDDDNNQNYNIGIAVRQTIMPTYKKIYSNEIICQDTLTVTCADGYFTFSDGDCSFRYPCKYHQKHGYGSYQP
jgi:hypothetical protein